MDTLMNRNTAAIGVLALVAVSMGSAGAAAQQQKHTRVLDADYSGALTCAKLPFTDFAIREPITVSIDSGHVTYVHTVRLRAAPEPAGERGVGQLDSDKLALRGSWKGEAGEYQATYSGTFVRRSAKLVGTQTWTYQGHIVTRPCSGTVKRAFRVFLPFQKSGVEQ